jgi:hypothetical protein
MRPGATFLQNIYFKNCPKGQLFLLRDVPNIGPTLQKFAICRDGKLLVHLLGAAPPEALNNARKGACKARNRVHHLDRSREPRLHQGGPRWPAMAWAQLRDANVRFRTDAATCLL